MKWTRTFFLLVILSFPGLKALGQGQRYDVPTPVISWKGRPESIIKEYNSTLETWAKKTCTPSVRREFQDLYKKYRAAGFYIPTLDKKDIDSKTIEKNLPLIKQKLEWIQSLKKNLESSESLPDFRPLSQKITKRINELLEFKKSHALEKNNRKKKKILKASREGLKAFQKEFAEFTSAIPFLLSFQFPVDHFSNRFHYEKFKGQDDTSSANDVFFKRQVFEDGALDPDHTRSDLYLRTTLDTIAIQLKQPGDFLSEDVRFDLEWVLGMIKSNLARGMKTQRKRISEWEERTKNELAFYQDLISEKGRKNSERLVANKAKATSKLREFVYRKHAATYDFFSKQPELIQALFVFDQILLNEVGLANSENYRDRRDIAQIVINRRYHTRYSAIENDESLYSYLKEHTNLKKGQITANKWLNVMFKEEQFSFTLYFIPAVQMVFCPDFYKTAKVSREKNLGLALDVLKKPNASFKALRYFSRFSMVGKIDMGQMWDGYVPLPPSPGRSLKLSSRLKEALDKSLYRYLYHFIGSDGEKYHVIEIGKNSYVVQGLQSKPKFFNYRSPHHFTYFEPKAE